MGQKQTATQWLAEQMNTAKWKFADVTDRNAIIQQALQMEKEQIIEAHGNKQKLSKGATNYEYTLTGEMYYNEKFKGIKTEI